MTTRRHHPAKTAVVGVVVVMMSKRMKLIAAGILHRQSARVNAVAARALAGANS
jgi:hypothetical protein